MYLQKINEFVDVRKLASIYLSKKFGCFDWTYYYKRISLRDIRGGKFYFDRINEVGEKEGSVDIAWNFGFSCYPSPKIEQFDFGWTKLVYSAVAKKYPELAEEYLIGLEIYLNQRINKFISKKHLENDAVYMREFGRIKSERIAKINETEQIDGVHIGAEINDIEQEYLDSFQKIRAQRQARTDAINRERLRLIADIKVILSQVSSDGENLFGQDGNWNI